MNQQLAKQIKNLEILLLQPEIRRSKEKLNELLADDFIEFGMFGKVYNQKSVIEDLTNSGEKEKFQKYNASDFEAKEIANNTIILTYKASVEFLKSNEKFSTLRCSIWQKRNENWQMIFHQGTIIKK